MIYGKIVLAGNPNVGKSTLFNSLTGMKQHTGNWSGKTVGTAKGRFKAGGKEIELIDLPGTYSLITDSAEEEITRNFLCFEEFDGAVILCDACCLERGLIFALQTAQLIPKTLLCVNMLDDAEKKGIKIDIKALSEETGLPAIGISAAKGEGIEELKAAMLKLLEEPAPEFIPVRYPKALENAIKALAPAVFEDFGFKTVFPVLRVLENEHGFALELEKRFGNGEKTASEREKAILYLADEGIAEEDIAAKIASCNVFRAEEICLSVVSVSSEHRLKDDRIDSVLTGRLLGIPIMLLLFGFIFWITVSGANYPSAWLSLAFEKVGTWLEALLSAANAPLVLKSLLVDGIWKVLGWVVAVMLPPMAIFFPLFTILEDIGYLPRVAFNLDRGFKSAGACGKQALTICMGLGCGAVGVTGARIIDSPRERLISIITNSFMPCNGRLPAIIALTSMFFTDSSVLGAAILTLAVAFSVLMTFIVSKILSKTVLKGVPTGFTLELPPYRMPDFGKVIIRSVFDRTLKILWRAIIVAVPAGVIIWLCSNIIIDGRTVLGILSAVFDPFARIFGLDGTIFCGFLLSFPANEIALPIMAMGYAGGELSELGSMAKTAALFSANGFTKITALCTAIFFLFHWPCATTLITIQKETKSIKWVLLSAAVPLITGLSLCFFINIISKLFL